MRSVPIILLSMLVADGAAACGCSMPSLESEPEVTQESDLVFVGDVVDVSLKASGGIEYVRARFKVVDLRKGPKAQFVTVEVRHGGTSCDLVRASFKIGERYLISGDEVKWGSPKNREAAGVGATETIYYNNFCDLRERLKMAPDK